MNFEELYALYWIQTEWNKVLSDKEIFSEEPLDVNENSIAQEPISTFYEEEKIISEATEISKDNSPAWGQIQQEEQTLSAFDYPFKQIDTTNTNQYENNIVPEIFEYPLETSKVQENLTSPQQDKEDTAIENWNNETFHGPENNQFREAVSKQAGVKLERPKINVIASQSNETPLETLMGANNNTTKNDIIEEDSWNIQGNIIQNEGIAEDNNSSYFSQHTSEHHTVLNPFKWANVFSEIKIFIVLFFTVFSTFFFFTNAKLVMITVNDFIWNSWDNQVSLITEDHNIAAPVSHTQEKLADLEENFQKIQKYKREEQDIALNMQDFLNQQQEAHLLNFNTLPPTNRLIVPDLDINVPLIDIPSMGEEDFENGNFDEELMNGVVKYPTTAAPGSQGNSLIFWHSSSEWWKHNEYGFIFRNLPRLQPGQKIQVIWNGQLTTYEMIERKVVNPKDVWNYYHEFVRDWEYYLTLMGCYPIGSSSQRMMVVAKKVSN